MPGSARTMVTMLCNVAQMKQVPLDSVITRTSIILPDSQLPYHPPEMSSNKKDIAKAKAIAKAASESQEGYSKVLDTLSLFDRPHARKAARKEARAGVKKLFPLETHDTYDVLREEAARKYAPGSRSLRWALEEVNISSG